MGSIKYIKFITLLFLALVLNACSISYKFNGASIDYSKTKSISISDFPITAELVYMPLSQQFSQQLRDVYAKQTRLQVIRTGGDMHLEGEITGYKLDPVAIGADAYASQTRLTVSIAVRFTNAKTPEDDFEKTYSASEIFDSSLMLNDVQDELLKKIIETISDQIYNETVAKW